MPHDSIVDEMMSLIQMHGYQMPFLGIFASFFNDMNRLFLSSPQKISTVYVLFGYNSK